MASMDDLCNLREQQGAESGHLLPLPQVTVAEATDAVKAAAARVAKRTIVTKGQEDKDIYQNFQRQSRLPTSPVYRKVQPARMAEYRRVIRRQLNKWRLNCGYEYEREGN